MTLSSMLLLPILLVHPVVPATGMRPTTNGATATRISPILDAATRKHVIDAAIARMGQVYVFPAKVPVIGKALRAGLASGRYALTDPKAFSDVVNHDIEAVANDRHMRLFWSENPLSMSAQDKSDPAILQRESEFFARINYGVPKAEVLAGNIGYLRIDGFVDPEHSGPTVVAAMAFLKQTEAMIIDLRDSHGGDPATVSMVMSYFVPGGTLINTFHNRDKAVDDQSWTFAYVPGGRWSTDKPVYVLTSGKTASASEEFAYDMQQLKRGLVVGGTTWGGANPGGMETLDQHFSMFIPSGAAVNPISRTNWEGTGVKPDIRTDPEVALEAARHLALETLAKRASGPRHDDSQKTLRPIPVRKEHGLPLEQ